MSIAGAFAQLLEIVVALALAPLERLARAVVVAAALAAFVVALSRAYLQVHFPTDIVAGLVAGAAWAWGLCLLPGARR